MRTTYQICRIKKFWLIESLLVFHPDHHNKQSYLMSSHNQIPVAV